MREQRTQRTQRIVYQTSAVHEGIWTKDPEIFGLLFATLRSAKARVTVRA